MIKLTKWIGIIERCSIQYRNNEYKDIGLCGAHQMYIFVLCRRGGLSQDELAKEVFVNKSNVTRSLKILEEEGFIRIENDDSDKRINRVYPTDKAFEILPLITNKTRKWNSDLLEGLTEEEIEVLDKALKILAKNAINKIEDLK